MKFSPVGSQIMIKMTERDPSPKVPDNGNTNRGKQSELKHRVKENRRLLIDDEVGMKEKGKGNLGFWSCLKKPNSFDMIGNGTYLYFYLSIHPCAYLSIYLSVYLSIYRCIYLFIYLFIYLCICLSIYLSM